MRGATGGGGGRAFGPVERPVRPAQAGGVPPPADPTPTCGGGGALLVCGAEDGEAHGVVRLQEAERLLLHRKELGQGVPVLSSQRVQQLAHLPVAARIQQRRMAARRPVGDDGAHAPVARALELLAEGGDVAAQSRLEVGLLRHRRAIALERALCGARALGALGARGLQASRVPPPDEVGCGGAVEAGDGRGRRKLRASRALIAARRPERAPQLALARGVPLPGGETLGALEAGLLPADAERGGALDVKSVTARRGLARAHAQRPQAVRAVKAAQHHG